MSKEPYCPDSISPATNIAALSMDAQREANKLEKEKINLTRRANTIATIAAIAAVIAAIAAIVAAVTSMDTKETIELIIKTTPK